MVLLLRTRVTQCRSETAPLGSDKEIPLVEARHENNEQLSAWASFDYFANTPHDRRHYIYLIRFLKNKR